MRATRTAAVLLLSLAACGETTRNGVDPSFAGAPSTSDPDSAGAAGAHVGAGGDGSAAGEAGSGGIAGEGGAGTGTAGVFMSEGGELGAGGRTPDHCARFATHVVAHAFGGGQSFNQEQFPEPLFGPPQANEPRSVVSLGNGGFVVLAFEGNAIVDGPGPDFTVFENPLLDYCELATVAVSEDGESWHEFSCTATSDGPDYGSCAGVGLVHSSSSNGVDPLDPAVSGGDFYDLADLGLSRAALVRITDRVDLVDDAADVFDLDAVAILHGECP